MLWLPRWPTDWLARHERALAHSREPLALYEKDGAAMRLAALDAEAQRLGLRIGQALADARAQIPGLLVREIEPERLERAFADFADWMSWASPVVAVLSEPAPYGDLVLDVTGVAHLFGGERRMLDHLVARLGTLGLSARGAVAPSIGAGWALAHFAGSPQVLEAPVAPVLADLPVAALRLTEPQVSGLMQMGLKRIGQLYERPRKPLQARFGAGLLTRLDQALGRAPERMAQRLPAPAHFTERRFAEPIGLIDDVLAATRDLAVRLGHELEAAGLGAQRFDLFVYRVDHKLMVFSVGAARPTRDPAHVARLFANRAERLSAEYDPGFGIDMIRLAADRLATLEPGQSGAFGMGAGSADLDRLHDRIAARLGDGSVKRCVLADSHLPERAVRLVLPGTDVAGSPPSGVPLPPRPLRLLPEPEPIRVIAEIPDAPPGAMVWRRVRYGFVKASGPERIGAEWWRSGARLSLIAPSMEEKPDRDSLPDPEKKPDPERTPRPTPLHVANLPAFSPAVMTRDYYVAEDAAGRRFWLFRLGLNGAGGEPSWFMHGLFS